MKKIKVNIDWCEKNYVATLVDKNVVGAVVVTHKTLEGAKEAFGEALAFHVEGMIEDGDKLPRWLVERKYTIEWTLQTSALLQNCVQYTSMAAIARASGINERLLSHYANGRKTPREPQRQRIINGLHKIGQAFLSAV